MKLGIRMILVLVSVALGAAALLGLVFGATSPVIEEQKEKAKKEALAQLMPDADTFIAQSVIEDSDTSVVYLAYRNGEKIGLVFTVSPRGYAGPVETMVGLSQDSSICAVRIASAAEGLKETPGLGARVLEDWFRDQFKGLKQEDVNLKKDGGKVEAITAATISSRAVTSGIRNGLGRYLPYLGQAPQPCPDSAIADSASDSTSSGTPCIKKVVVANGFAGSFNVVVMLTPEGKIAKVAIPAKDFPETEGYGTLCLEESFLVRFTGLESSEQVENVQAVTGATRTSQAVKTAVASSLGK